MGHESLVLEVATGFELFEKRSNALEVIGVGELGDGLGEDDAVEVVLRRQRGGEADVDDAFGILLGLEERERGSGLLFAGEWSRFWSRG